MARLLLLELQADPCLDQSDESGGRFDLQNRPEGQDADQKLGLVLPVVA